MRILPRAVLTSHDVRSSVWLVAVLRIALGLAGLLTVLLDPRPLLRDLAVWTSLEVLDGRPWTLLFSLWQRWGVPNPITASLDLSAADLRLDSLGALGLDQLIARFR